MIYQPFFNGVLGILFTKWTCKLKSPMTIRNSNYSAFQQSNTQKGRGNCLVFNWEKPELAEIEKSYFAKVSDFYNDFIVDDDQIRPVYNIPASSIRGVLRNEAIKRLIKLEDRNLFDIPKKNEEAINLEEISKQINTARTVLKERKKYWFDILSLFGNTFEIETGQDNPYTWSGRLLLKTIVSKLEGNERMYYTNEEFEPINGPRNLKTQITIRNPLDRVTQGARDGGLHAWVELCEEQSFSIEFHILNPTSFDIDLLKVWKQDINEGLIRFGALVQQGKGQIEISNEEYNFYLSRNTALYKELDIDEDNDLISNNSLFDQVWSGQGYINLNEVSKIDFDKLA